MADTLIKNKEGFWQDAVEIECECNDPSCESRGEGGELDGHIENCPCQRCHNYFGKL